MRRDLFLHCRIFAIAMLLASCGSGMCARKSDCAAGQTCTAGGVCEYTSDAGVDDESGGEDASIDSSVDQEIDAAVGDAQ